MLVKAVKRYHIYLYGTKFKVITDCNALAYVLKKTSINPRVNRWILCMQNYNFDLKMLYVDDLSRISVAAIDIISLTKELYYKQLDPICVKLLKS